MDERARRGRRGRCAARLLAVALIAAPAAPAAAAAPPAAAAAKDEAAHEMEAGNAALAGGDVEAALAHFDRAHALLPDATGPLVALGLAYEKKGDCKTAVPLLNEYLGRKGADALPDAWDALGRCGEGKPAAGSPTAGSGESGAGRPGAAGSAALSGESGGAPRVPAPATKSVSPLRIAGPSLMVFGVAALVASVGSGVAFLVTRSKFTDDTAAYRDSSHDPIAADFTSDPGGPYDLCDPADQTLLTSAARADLAPAIDRCRSMKTTRLVGWVLGVAGATLLGTGIAVTALSNSSAAAAGEPPMASVTVDVLPGGAAARLALRF
jgi:tetratricopeptide (TPR) repeat protein